MNEEMGAYAYCSCGQLNLLVKNSEGGQSLFGTAAYKALLHEQECSGSSKVYPAWESDEGEVTVMSGRLPQAQKNAIVSSKMYYE